MICICLFSFARSGLVRHMGRAALASSGEGGARKRRVKKDVDAGETKLPKIEKGIKATVSASWCRSLTVE